MLSQAIVARKAGVDAIDAIGSTNGAFKIDIHEGGKMTIPAPDRGFSFERGIVETVFSECCGPDIKGTRCACPWNRRFDVMDRCCGDDHVRRHCVLFCSLLMLHGFEALQKVERGLRKYMEQHDYRKLDDFRNAALSYVAPSMADCDVISSVAKVDREKRMVAEGV